MAKNPMAGLGKTDREKLQEEFLAKSSLKEVAVKQRGRRKNSDEVIKSRTVSMEDEYHELVDLLRIAPRRANLSRSDVFRAALVTLAVLPFSDIKAALELSLETKPEQIKELIKELDKKIP
ncbi:hypothetical protein KKJ09_13325 [Xenorhabdus bovienii]|uniref:hypothetical protein n=1 Tax=Xenorhabdus bovienii TaxID=40576 RepID=UPI0023B22246|nr:hypothetical protein [Xenorhabdus bovienii]MDE9494539.1 hypothetical protein [Xenorhabdus bovienii]MDE9502936.1 hypothetical protein [Xenorhabdus bovienii]MDE9526586.1 hypothetical protein [Xenorhabdus bovienii]